VSEGAGAILLQRSAGTIEIDRIDPGANFFRRSEAAEKLRRVARRLGENDLCVGSANGTFIDDAEQTAIQQPCYSPKFALGDSIGASVLWQVIAAAQALRTSRLPGHPIAIPASRALVLACGLNQQLGGLTLRLL
jgi:hypothetical protein